MRKGYDKSQVDDYVVRSHYQMRDLEDRLTWADEEIERLRAELARYQQKGGAADPRGTV